MKKDKYYLAIIRIHYEGIIEENMKLCTTRKLAHKHLCHLRKKHGTSMYDFNIIELPINATLNDL